MIKKYCDICEQEITKDNPEYMKDLESKANLYKHGGTYQFSFEIKTIISFDVTNFHVCNGCIMQAINNAIKK